MSKDLEAFASLMRMSYQAQVEARKRLAEAEAQQEVIFRLVAAELKVPQERVQYDPSMERWVVTPEEGQPSE